VPPCGHDDEQRAKIVLSLEPTPCEIVPAQPGGRGALGDRLGSAIARDSKTASPRGETAKR
jgi:hypothetical protein